MAKRGPKYKYDSWMCDCIREVASVQGQYRAAMLWEIGCRLAELNETSKRPISPDTFARWRKENPEFEEAWQESQIISQALDERACMEFATGKTKGNATAFALIFNAKYKEEYKPSEGSGNTTINNLTIENLSADEMQYRIARAQESLMRSGQLQLPSQSTPNIIEAEFEEVESDE